MTVTVSPGAWDRMAATSASPPSMSRSPTPVMTAPCSIPARSAGPPGSTARTSAPSPSGESLTETPSTARVAYCCLISWSAIRLAWSTGMAKPRPIDPELPDPNDAMAELIPTSSPFMLTSAPPELPGFTAASVWMASITVLWSDWAPPARTGRFSAETMPVVTVPDNPSGDPTAATACPSVNVAEVPRAMGVSGREVSALMTAMSVAGSVPTTLAGALEPSSKRTWIWPPA